MKNMARGDAGEKPQKSEGNWFVRKVCSSMIDATVNAVVPVGVAAVLALFGFGCPKFAPQSPAMPPQGVVIPQQAGGQPAAGE